STAILLNQLKELRYNGLILGTNNFSGPPINEMALTALEGSIFTAPQFYSASNNAKMIEFGNKVKGLYGKEAQWNTAVEYDAIYIVAKAIKNAKSYNGDEVRNALEQIGDFDGLAGKYRYSPNGEWVLELAVRTYKNGIQIPLDK
ncbi:MAG: hypothetical protein FJW63_10320, partial [Actinobacteria bacterium]|nr:hypothetical protein [Actinomycetota bacterium]